MFIKKWVKKQWKYINPPQSTLVLMYHRVIDSSLDPWDLTVSPENFEQHLKILKSSGLVAPSSQIIDNIQKKNKLKTTIVITFDDGYRDNFLYAKPILEAHDLPATFFISNKHIGTQKLFWWDELSQIILESSTLPKILDLKYNDLVFYFDLDNEIFLTDKIRHLHKVWNASISPPSLRSQLYLELWEILGNKNYREQQAILKTLRTWAGINEGHSNGDDFSMTQLQLQSLSESPLFTIGGHTVSHPLLPLLSKENQRTEIYKNKQYLESIVKLPIDTFAYPSGKFNEITKEELETQGFKTAFTTNERLIKPKVNPFQMGRFQVKNWTGHEFEQKLAKWMV